MLKQHDALGIQKNENFSTLYVINIALGDEYEEAKSILEDLYAKIEADKIYISEKITEIQNLKAKMANRNCWIVN